MKKIICLLLTLTALLVFPIGAAADFIRNSDGSSSYRNDDGEYVKGFTKINGSNYYFDRNGKMLTGAYIIEGEHYRFHSDGRMYIGWIKLINGKYNYYLNNGMRAKGWTTIDNSRYFFNTDGSMLNSGAFIIENKICTFGSDGKLTSIKGNYCLSGFFGESFNDLNSLKPSVIYAGEIENLSFAADLIPPEILLDNITAIGTDIYLFADDKLIGGLRSFSRTGSQTPSSILSSDYSTLLPLTEKQIETLYEKYYDDCEKKYGEEIDDEVIDSADEDFAEGIDKIAVFSDKYTVSVVAVKGKTVSYFIIEMETIVSDKNLLKIVTEAVKSM
jgi:hypothetical protein